ncbi:class I glutamine amidotransferase-like protein [Protomyces lactucae-debilis]|uniref:Class I glutamine amidotransferase-like protein n=1 Tax=Protomyces lactucae-debilis TaxID=2754530 RepID=A0A1Y2ESS2_PROLT|nr:class I glutamine amidotransferase-like protein [Protomyces lactucae-debilis]ORY74620.1 class I glutamine amidotransferase-like protein [Protomyces lactucae-debilis]
MTVLKVACFLNTHPSSGDLGMDYDQWHKAYRTFLLHSIIASGHAIELDYHAFDPIKAQVYPSTDDLNSFDLILLTGGTDHLYQDIPWVAKMVSFLQDVVQNHTCKVIAICWGFQAVAAACGGQVMENTKGLEVGITPVTLNEKGSAFFHRGPQLRIHQVHKRIISKLPDGFQLLGSSDKTENQIAMLPGRILCFQGHPELTEAILRVCLSDTSHFGKQPVDEQLDEHDGIEIGARLVEWLVSDTPVV